MQINTGKNQNIKNEKPKMGGGVNKRKKKQRKSQSKRGSKLEKKQDK